MFQLCLSLGHLLTLCHIEGTSRRKGGTWTDPPALQGIHRPATPATASQSVTLLGGSLCCEYLVQAPGETLAMKVIENYSNGMYNKWRYLTKVV